MSLISPSDRLFFNGIEYQASGTLNLATPPVLIDTLRSIPFTLTGTIDATMSLAPQWSR